MSLSSSIWHHHEWPLLIAEVGGNHEGDYGKACQLCDLAIDSGVDYVKFQVYTANGLVNRRLSPERHEHFQSFELTAEQHIALAERCRSANIGYCASIWELEALRWIDDYVDFYKVGSGDLTAWPLLQEFAKRGKPILLSTGLASLQEVLETINFLQLINPIYNMADSLALLQCTTTYPTEDCEANLRAMDTLRESTGCIVGYSDHTRGSLALLAAAARGARILEFHFTDQREGKTFRDHAVSLKADEVLILRQQLQRIAEMLGDGRKSPTQNEIESGHVESFRRALYSPTPLKKGEPICAESLIALRPNVGLDARRFLAIDGISTARDISAFDPITADKEDG